MEKFQNKYRIESTRMPFWDYAGNGIYFITLVINYRDCLFGKINNSNMIFSEMGKIVYKEWYRSFNIRKELYLDEFIVMPNHIHAIIILKKQNSNNSTIKTHDRSNVKHSKFYRKSKSISSFIAGYKSSTVSLIDDFIDKNNIKMGKFNRYNHLWQPNYYDHIIRDENEYRQIKYYIKNNPKNWEEDKFYK